MFLIRCFIIALFLPCLALAQQDAVTIGNGLVTANISPSLGRIVSFGLAQGNNLLWLESANNIEERKQKKPEGWINYGGDKVWPLPQSNWPIPFGTSWPPSPALEGLPWTLSEHSSTRAVFRSRPIAKLGIRLTREIEIPAGGHSMVIKNRIERYEANPFPVQIWSITQIVSPKYCLLEIPPGSDSFVEFFDKGSAKPAAGGLGHFPRADGREAKTGTLGSWVAAVYPDGLILLQCIGVKPGGCYPDSASVEAYSNPHYMELETLGEQRHLMPGEAMENLVIWHIMKKETVETINRVVQDIKEKQWM